VTLTITEAGDPNVGIEPLVVTLDFPNLEEAFDDDPEMWESFLRSAYLFLRPWLPSESFVMTTDPLPAPGARVPRQFRYRQEGP